MDDDKEVSLYETASCIGLLMDFQETCQWY